MTAEQIKALDDLKLLTAYELYNDLKSTSFKDTVVREMLAIEIDIRKI